MFAENNTVKLYNIMLIKSTNFNKKAYFTHKYIRGGL